MIQSYRHLLNDRRRIKAFQNAISSLCNEHTSVAEIGSALGTYSFFAAKNGAQPIYAIEMDDIFYTGKKLANINGFEDDITFYHQKSTEVELPKKVDYIIMEDYRPFFLYKGLEDVITDARNRFLKDKGQFIPNKICLKLCPVQSEKLWNNVALWESQNKELYNIDWHYTTKMAFNQPHYAQGDSSSKRLLSEPISIKDIILAEDSNFPFKLQQKISIDQAGTIHGLIGWWDCYFTFKQYFSNSPQAPSNTWGQTFFPFEEPIKVEQGQEIKIGIFALESSHSGDINYKWTIEYGNNKQVHNTFQGSNIPIEKHLNKKISAKPKLSQKGRIIKYLFNQIGTKSYQEIAENLLDKFPDDFSDQKQAHRFINKNISSFLKNSDS